MGYHICAVDYDMDVESIRSLKQLVIPGESCMYVKIWKKRQTVLSCCNHVCCRYSKLWDNICCV